MYHLYFLPVYDIISTEAPRTCPGISNERQVTIMKKYVCPCGYVYDPEVGDPDNGVAPGTAWEDVPEDWVCPVCMLGKDAFEEE